MHTSFEIYVLAGMVSCIAGKYDIRIQFVSVFVVIAAAVGFLFFPGEHVPVILSIIYGLIILSLGVCCGIWMSDGKAESLKNDFGRYGKYLIILMVLFELLIVADNLGYKLGISFGLNKAERFYENRIRLADDVFFVFLSAWLIWYGNAYSDSFLKDKLEQLLAERLMEFSFEDKNVKPEIKQNEADRKKKFEDFCRLYSLTGRECEIAALMLEGKNNNEICEQLSLCLGTVKAHVHSILSKLSISRRTQLMNCFEKHMG